MAWLTTWQDEAPAAFTGLLGSDMPVIPRPATAEIWWKIDALLGYLTEHPDIRRVAFADDHLDREDDLGLTYRETLAEALDYLRIEHLLVAPDSAVGLTVEDLAGIEAWLLQPRMAREPEHAALRPLTPESAVLDPGVLAEPAAEPISEPTTARPIAPAQPPVATAFDELFTAPVPRVPSAPIRRFQSVSQGGTDFD